MNTCNHPKSPRAQRCRACAILFLQTDPEIRAKREEANRRRFADPAQRHAAAEKLRAVTRGIMADPVKREARAARARETYKKGLGRADVQEKIHSPEVRARAGKKISATKLRDIPSHLRDDYRRLTTSLLYKAADAKEIILDGYRKEIERKLGGKS